MEIEVTAVITIAPKLALLEKLLDRRIARAAFDTVSPTLPLLDKVYRLGEYKRLAANLAVMEHRIRCGIGERETELIVCAADCKYGLDLHNKRVRAALSKAHKILRDLGVSDEDLRAYKKLPLYKAECKKLKLYAAKKEAESVIPVLHDGGYADCRDDRTVPA